jgi:hypothetical protein
MGIVALGSALVVLISQHSGGSDAAAGSRVIQGVITGIGFLGAGVILRNPAGKKVHGLTTAANLADGVHRRRLRVRRLAARWNLRDPCGTHFGYWNAAGARARFA